MDVAPLGFGLQSPIDLVLAHRLGTPLTPKALGSAWFHVGSGKGYANLVTTLDSKLGLGAPQSIGTGSEESSNRSLILSLDWTGAVSPSEGSP